MSIVLFACHHGDKCPFCGAREAEAKKHKERENRVCVCVCERERAYSRVTDVLLCLAARLCHNSAVDIMPQEQSTISLVTDPIEK